MAKLIKDWNDLIDLETEHYMVLIDKETGKGFVAPNLPPMDDGTIFFGLQYEISQMHNNTCQEFVRLLQKYGFDVEFDNNK